jgi:hypothetical protein
MWWILWVVMIVPAELDLPQLDEVRYPLGVYLDEQGCNASKEVLKVEMAPPEWVSFECKPIANI